jgi:hypothetical protein
VTHPKDSLSEALAHALRKAADAGQWELVSELAETIAKMGRTDFEDAPEPGVVVSLRDRIK